jgi:hypothetical protein
MNEAARNLWKNLDEIAVLESRKPAFEIHLDDRIIKIFATGEVLGLENWPGKKVVINRIPLLAR